MQNVDVPTGNSIDRRTVLATTVTAAGAVALGGATSGAAVAAPGDRRGRAATITTDRDHLSLTLRTAPTTEARGAAKPLVIRTTNARAFEVKVSADNTHVALGTTEKAAAGDAREVTVTLSRDKPATVWASPRKVGEPMKAAAILDISSTEFGGRSVDVWIEPTGGSWGWLKAPGRNEPLDLGIIPVHAALLSHDGGRIVMWSPPRKRDPKTNKPLRRKGDPTQWEWDVFHLDDVEARSLDLKSLTTVDQAMDADGGPAKETIFCGGAAHLPDGRLFVAGGHIVPKEKTPGGHGSTHNARNMYVYDPKAPQGQPAWEHVGSMKEYRWYPTVTTLPDGRMMVCSGSREVLEGNTNDEDRKKGFWQSYCNSYEIYDPQDKALVRLAGDIDLIDVKGIDLKRKESLATYPGVFVLPKPGGSGTVIAVAEGNRGWLYEYAPQRSSTRPLVRGDRMFRMRNLGSRSYPHYGAMVLLPFRADGREMGILAVGGQDAGNSWRSLADNGPATSTAEVLHIDTGKSLTDQQGWKRTAPMSRPRILCDTTLLADGTVLLSGGSRRGWGDNNIEHIKDSELYDPGTGTFRAAATAATDRRYHSISLLLPDGSVLKSGSTGGYGDQNDPRTKKPWLQTHDNSEIYYPPYLFRGPRPSIRSIDTTGGTGPGPSGQSSPSGQSGEQGADAEQRADAGPVALTYGGRFTVSGSGGVVGTPGRDGQDGRRTVRVAVVRLGSITHGNDMDQRYVWLNASVEPTDTGWVITAEAPRNPAATPPGDYQLLVLDETGIPSETRFVRFSAAG